MRNDDCKPDWWCVALDETRYWNIAEEDRPYIEKIMGVYFYDAREYTYCCEITPSYYLRYLDNAIYLKGDVPDEIRDRIYDKYVDPSDDCYMHVADVNGIPDDRKHHYGEVDDEEEKEKQEEIVREYYQGNPAF